MLEFKVTNQLLVRVDKFSPATDSVDYLKAKFLFNTTDWNGKTKTALFRVGTETYKKILNSDGTCTIPSEVLVASSDSKSRIASNTNKIYVSLIGEYSTTRITTNEVKVELNLSGYGDALTPSNPTQSEYQQIVTQYENARTEMQEATEECQNAQERLDGVGNLFANAIKGHLSGAVVFADDVSPVEHNPVVKALSRNKFDISNYVTEKDYSNGKMIYAISAENLVIGKEYKVFSKVPLQWFKISNSATGYSCVGLQNDTVGFTSYTFIHQRNANIHESEPLNIYVNNLEKTAMYDTSIMASMEICIVEIGDSDEYTPYIDTSTVTVARCGKNLSKQSHISIKGTVSTNGSIGGFHGGILMRDLRVQPSATYVVSMNKPAEVTNPCVFFYNGKLSDSSITHTACYVELVSGGRGEQVSALEGAVTNINNYEYMAVTTGNESNYAENTETSISIKNLQIESGESVTAFEAYNGTDYTPNADGTVEGITSLSPNMTILTDTEGVIVECEYIKDTNVVVKKLADALGITI